MKSVDDIQAFEQTEDIKFGVLLIGAPGTGKTTFSKALHDFFDTNLERKHCMVNLDPANDNLVFNENERGPAKTIDVRDLITVEDAMEEFNLGPNGAMLYCLEFLLANFQWLSDQLNKKFIQERCSYFIFDMPGQVELYTNHPALKNLIKRLEKEVNFRCVGVHMVDVSYLYDRYRFLSAMTLSLTALINLETPFLNFITKIDLLGTMGKPEMNLCFYQGTTYGLKYLFFGEYTDSEIKQSKSFKSKYARLTKHLCEMLENYQQVAFTLLDITDRLSLTNALMKIDRANSFFSQPQRLENPKETLIDYEAVEQYFDSSEATMDLEEKYFS